MLNLFQHPLNKILLQLWDADIHQHDNRDLVLVTSILSHQLRAHYCRCRCYVERIGMMLPFLYT
jgi:hypothetical protein